MEFAPFFIYVLPVITILAVGLLGSTRRIGFWLALLASILLTPVGGFVLALVLGLSPSSGHGAEAEAPRDLGPVPHPESVVDKPPVDDRPTLRERLYRWLNQLQFLLYTVLVLVLLAVGFLWKRMFIVIEPGYRGVMYRTVYGGTVTSRTWSEGLHVIPWDRLQSYDLRLQQKTLDFSVLSDEGLSLGGAGRGAVSAARRDAGLPQKTSGRTTLTA